MSEQDQDDQPRKRRCRAACKQCRQAKVKCGMEQTPCNRCQRIGYACEWDQHFKRTRNQDRFRELEQRLESLQQAAPANQQSVLTPASAGHSSASTHAAAIAGESDGSARYGVKSSDDAGTGNRPATSTDTNFFIRDIRLNQTDALNLFAKFFDRYHVYAPFLDPDMSTETCHRETEFLFWAIVSVAAREQQPHTDFLSMLSPYFKESLGEIVMGTVLSLRSVQALILLALWPPTNDRFWGDRSMTLATNAVTTAMYLGLHNPYYEQEYTNVESDISDGDRAERARTWIACVSVAQNLAMDVGIPLRLPFANWKVQEIASLATGLDIPLDLQHYLVIQQHAYSIFNNVPQRGSSGPTSMYYDTLQAHINKADADFQKFMSTSVVNMSHMNKIRYATVQLYLRSMHFLIDPSLLQQKQGVLKAYDTAISLVTTFVSEDGASEILTYSPRTTIRTLLLACCVIFKVLFSSYGSKVDFNSGKMSFNAALLCMRQQAVQYKESKDFPLRCGDSMKRLWHLGEISPSIRTVAPELAVHTRLGASVVYHCLAVYFDRLALFYRQRQHEAPNNTAFQLPDGFDSLPLPDIDPDMAFANFSMDFSWDPSIAQPSLQGFL